MIIVQRGSKDYLQATSISFRGTLSRDAKILEFAMNYVSFFVQMDSETGLPEFFLEETTGRQHDVEVGVVRERLESMRLRLRY